MITRHPPGLAIFDRPLALTTGAINDTEPSVLQSNLLHPIAVIRQKTEKKLSAAQSRYKDHHDRYICATVTLTPAQLVYMDRLPPAVAAPDLEATDSYPKLLCEG